MPLNDILKTLMPFLPFYFQISCGTRDKVTGLMRFWKALWIQIPYRSRRISVKILAYMKAAEFYPRFVLDNRRFHLREKANELR